MSIIKLSFKDRTLLFAKLSSIAYYNTKKATSQAKKLGFTTTEFYDRDGAQAYRFMNKTDIVIACRGTQPNEFNDIRADLRAVPVMAETVGKVHLGFKQEVDDLWPMVCEDINRKVNLKKQLWFCGHSLGAAMACIAASRLYESRNVEHVYTYGCPRIGNKHWVEQNHFKHSRVVNNNDIVPKVPLAIMGFKHHGKLEYINYYGNFRTATIWQRSKDQWRGRWRALQKFQLFDGIMDHLVTNYVKKLNKSK